MRHGLLAALCLLAVSSARADSAAPPAFPTNVTILTRQDWVPGPYVSVADVLDRVPGLSMTHTASRGNPAFAAIRGLSDSRLLVLIDGRPLSPVFDGAVDLSEIPLEMVERVEVTRGGTSLSYGAGGIGGVVNVITARPERKGLTTDLGTGVGRDGGKDLQGRFFGRFYAGDLTYTAGRTKGSGYTDNDGVETTSHFGSIARSFKGKGFWEVNYAYHDNKTGLSRGTTIPFETWDAHREKEVIDPSSRRYTERQNIGFRAATPPLAGTTVYVDLSWFARNEKERPAENVAAVFDGTNRALRSHLRWLVRGYEVGLEDRADERSVYGAPTEHASQHGLYAIGTQTMGRLGLTESLRGDIHSDAGAAFTPRLVARYGLSDRWSASASAEAANRMPLLAETYPEAALRNTDLDPEHGRSADAGVRYRPNDDLQLTATLFGTRVQNPIRFDPATNRYENRDGDRSRGLELAGILRTHAGAYGNSVLTLQWTSLSAKIKTDAGAWVGAAEAPEQNFYAEWDHLLPRKMTFTHILRYRSKQYTEPGENGVKIPSFYVYNLRFSVRIWSADLYAQVDNLTRRRYAESAATSPSGTHLMPQPERVFWCGILIRFLD